MMPGEGGSKARSEIDLDSEFIAGDMNWPLPKYKWSSILIKSHIRSPFHLYPVFNPTAYQILSYRSFNTSFWCKMGVLAFPSHFKSSQMPVWCWMGLLSFTSLIISYLYIRLSGVAWAYYSSTSIISYHYPVFNPTAYQILSYRRFNTTFWRKMGVFHIFTNAFPV